MSDPSDIEGARGFEGLKGLSARKAQTGPPEITREVGPEPVEPQLPPAWKAPNDPQRRPPASQTTAPKSRGWLVAVFVVGGLLFFAWLGTSGGGSKRSVSSPAYAVSPAPDPSSAPERPPIVDPYRPSKLLETMPPVGRGHVLAASQLRYCAFQGIRVNGAEKAVDTYNGSAVDHFNSMVNDYNSRCGSFQYRRGVLAPVQGEAEAIRLQLEEEGRQSMSDFITEVATPPEEPAFSLEDAKPQTADFEDESAKAAWAADKEATVAFDAIAGETDENTETPSLLSESAQEVISDCSELPARTDKLTGERIGEVVYSYRIDGRLHFSSTKPESCK